VTITAAEIKCRASELGFDVCGIAPASDHPELRFLPDWLDRGYGASMTYLQRTSASRLDVRNVLPSAQTVIVTATLYNTDRPYTTECADGKRAQVARYAWGDDYHVVIGRRLEALLAWMCAHEEQEFEARCYIDTGPVQERVYAQHAGVGWIGKNTCVIHPALGSWIFLGEIVCSLPLAVDPPALDQCGTCTLCLEACPTGAFVAPRELDSRRCISYLTIEHRGELPERLGAAIGSHVYGCDICQEVCPWNAVAPESADPAWQPRPFWDGRSVEQLLQTSDADLQTALEGSAMKRAKASGLRRNFEQACINAGAHEVANPRR